MAVHAHSGTRGLPGGSRLNHECSPSATRQCFGPLRRGRDTGNVLNSNGFSKQGVAPSGDFGTPRLNADARHSRREWRRCRCQALLETLVDGQGFAGTCYRAGNWIPLGRTQELGRIDRHHEADGSARKLLPVYPLCRDVQQRLRETQAPCCSEAEADCRSLPTFGLHLCPPPTERRFPSAVLGMVPPRPYPQTMDLVEKARIGL